MPDLQHWTLTDGVLVMPGALKPEQCATFRGIYDELKEFGSQKDYSGNPSVHYWDMHNKPSRYDRILKPAALFAQSIVQTVFKQPHMVEAAFVARQLPGSVIEPHYDATKLDGSPNHTPQRSHALLFYLNDDYEGGEICFPYQKLVVKPTFGMAVSFGAFPPFLHYVKPIKKACRYTLPVWFTLMPDKRLNFVED